MPTPTRVLSEPMPRTEAEYISRRNARLRAVGINPKPAAPRAAIPTLPTEVRAVTLREFLAEA